MRLRFITVFCWLWIRKENISVENTFIHNGWQRKKRKLVLPFLIRFSNRHSKNTRTMSQQSYAFMFASYLLVCLCITMIVIQVWPVLISSYRSILSFHRSIAMHGMMIYYHWQMKIRSNIDSRAATRKHSLRFYMKFYNEAKFKSNRIVSTNFVIVLIDKSIRPSAVCTSYKQRN